MSAIEMIGVCGIILVCLAIFAVGIYCVGAAIGAGCRTAIREDRVPRP